MLAHNAMSVDYLRKYMKKECFDFPGLLDDDFFKPIRLLFQNRHYVSAAKLLMTFIDSIGFIEYGDTGENTFRKWLVAYADLTEVGVSAEELWEHRNSLLHMSNVDSRKVRDGKVIRLILYVGNLPENIPSEFKEEKYYNLSVLIKALVVACERWLSTYNTDRSKFEHFVARYDLIVSDNRMIIVEVPE
jgi:hypothetical protein